MLEETLRIVTGGTKRMKKAQGQPTRHGRHDLWLSREYLPQLEPGTQQHGGGEARKG